MKPRPFLFLAICLVLVYFIQVTPLCEPIIKVDDGKTKSEQDAIYDDSQQSSLKNLIEEIKVIKVNSIGESMFPTIKNEEACICIKKEEYKVNDIVMFIRADNIAVAHRIVFMEEDVIITKGDGNSHIDYPISEKQIICSIPEVPIWQKLLM